MSEFKLDPGLLFQGTNLLAVEVHQCKSTSSDIVFGLRLRLAPPPKPGLVINEIAAAGQDGFIEVCNASSAPASFEGLLPFGHGGPVAQI